MASAVAASKAMTETLPAPEATLHMKLQTKHSQTMAPYPPSMPKPRGKLRIDPQRALEPARKKLSTVEAQRIMAVLYDSIRRTELLTALPYILENVERYKIVLGSDLCNLLESHKVIIQTFEELKVEAEKLLERGQRSPTPKGDTDYDEVADQEDGVEGEEGINTERPVSNASSKRSTSSHSHHTDSPTHKSPSSVTSAGSISSKADEAMRSLTMVARQMQYSCKNIMRGFAVNPTAVNTILRDAGIERAEHSDELIAEMNEIKDILMGKLLTTPVEEDERALYLREISERERYNSGIIAKLETELQAAVDDKEQEIKKKNDVIRRLQNDLHQIQKFSEEHIKRTKSEAEKQEAADVKNSDGKKGKLQQEIAQLRTQMQALTSEHRESEQTLRKKKYKIETEVENWIQKYDQDMGERQDEYEEIDAVYTEEKKQLNELEERFKTLQTEYDQIMEERRVAREKREAAERELQMCVGAATTIQAFWRSFKVRKALKGKKKKGKGKKGKK